ncbi:hypothetical protein F5144DRAFT_573499 [Chaetomium tenue]|uniref:Uncharacterized protein n=1 Tax=Chaetomium tenue TaxID=1854479 RepID=A0ACB7P8L5_9PEZI|nr:hypothetical protein F5144DRAFT_573499 [Chaetomium globosum]
MIWAWDSSFWGYVHLAWAGWGGHFLDLSCHSLGRPAVHFLFFASSSYTYTSGVVKPALKGHDVALELACLSGILLLVLGIRVGQFTRFFAVCDGRWMALICW